MEGSFRNSSLQSRSLSSSMGGRGIPRQTSPKPEYLCEEVEEGLRITVDKSKIGYLIGRQSISYQSVFFDEPNFVISESINPKKYNKQALLSLASNKRAELTSRSILGLALFL